jgi:hypothetical protein
MRRNKGMKKLMLFLMIFSLLSMGGFFNCDPVCEVKVVGEDGSPVTGAQVVFYDATGSEIQRMQPDSNGNVSYEDEWGDISVRVIPPEGMEAVEAEYQTGVKITDKYDTTVIVLRNKSGSMTATSTTTTTTTTTSTPTTTTVTTTTSTSTTATTSTSTTTTTTTTTSTTETTTSVKAEPLVLYPVNINSLYGYNPGTDSASLIQDYVTRKQLLLYKNSNGASRVLIEFAYDQPALRDWLKSVESYSAYLVLQRTTETLDRQQQAIIYSVDMEAWQSSSSTPPRSECITEFNYNFQDLWVSELHSMGPEIVAVWDQINLDTAFAGADSSGQLDIITWAPENILTFTVVGATGNLSILIDTPGGTQMTPGTELAWYDSAAIIFFANP